MLTNPITVIGVSLGLAHVQQIKPASVLQQSAHLIVVIYNLCSNSIFNDKEDIPTTEYFTTEELNIEIQKTPDNIRLIHINAVSLC